MEVSCPQCAQTFMLPEGAIGAAGRRLKCSKCGHIWFHAADGAAASLGPVAAENADSRHDPEAGVADQPPPDDATGDADVAGRKPLSAADTAPSGFDLLHRERQQQEQIFRARKAEKAQLQRRDRFLIGTLAFVLILLLGVFFGRAQLVAIWPPISKLFDVVGAPVAVVGENLLLEEITVERIKREDREILSVVGKVRNTSDEVQPVPAFLISLMDDEAAIIEELTFSIDVTVILPQEVISFSQEIADPEPGAEDVTLTFSSAAANDDADY